MEHNHESRGYDESVYGSHIAYHFIVGQDGTVKQNRALDERTPHTRNSVVNKQAIAVVFAGNFQETEPNAVQLQAGRDLIERLDAIYRFDEIIPHKDASPTACPGEHLLRAFADLWRGYKHVDEWTPWDITRYYSPEPGQLRYFRTGEDAYKRDVAMNCGLFSPEYIASMREKAKTDPSITVTDDGMVNGEWGDCRHPADGVMLKPEEAFKVAACPPTMKLGTRLEIEGIGIVTCRDRGGAIKNKRLDVWAGYGTDALHLMNQYPGGWLRVKVLP